VIVRAVTALVRVFGKGPCSPQQVDVVLMMRISPRAVCRILSLATPAGGDRRVGVSSSAPNNTDVDIDLASRAALVCAGWPAAESPAP